MKFPEAPIILVDDEQQILISYEAMLCSEGIDHIISVNDSRNVLPLLSSQEASLVILDLNMPYMSGIELLDKIHHEFSHVAVIIVTALNDLDNAVECMKKGAVDYIVKPVEQSRFIISVKKSLEISELRSEVTGLKKHLSALKHQLLSDTLEHESAFASYLTRSRKMRSLFHYMEAVARSDEPVLIMGETGTGKELLSRAVHDISGVAGAFVAVNVAGLDDTMFSDTLFGHTKGAFTGADSTREGLIVKAAGGTLFLDEIGDLNEMSQIKLLRLLEEGVPNKSGARIVACTNRDLHKRISAGQFREDLYYRLAAVQVLVPPLRERTEDIPLLLDAFLELSADTLKKKKPTPPHELSTLLSTYYFPGNIRELKAMVFDAVARHKGGVLSLDNFKQFIMDKGDHIQPGYSSAGGESGSLINLSKGFPTIKEVIDSLVSKALERAKGNQGIAASLLGITRQALNRRLTKKE